MAKNRFGKWEYTDEEISIQTTNATARAKKALLEEPHAKKAYYDKDHRKITVELSNGNAVILDPIHLPELAHARRKDLEQVEITPGGIGLHWGTLNVDYRIPELVMGVLGPGTWKKQLARYGGQVASPAKAMAARRNGLKGGRPAKKRSALAG
jgi:hypothetical protein